MEARQLAASVLGGSGEALLRQYVVLTAHRLPVYSLALSRQCRPTRYLSTSSPLHSLTNTPRRCADSSRPPRERDTNTDQISAMLEDSFDTNKPSRPGGTSVSDTLLWAAGISSPRPSNTPMDLSSMFDPQRNLATSRQPPPVPDKPLPFKLNASVGRTISVDTTRNMDVGRAFRTLDMTLNRNRVKQDERRQKFHERPGLKRKRLVTMRWRRRFKEGFRGIVKKVMKMKKQGW